MIAFLLMASLVLGLWLVKLPWLASSLLVLLAGAFAIHRFRKRGLIVLITCLAIGWAITNLDSISPKETETYRGFVVSSKENYFILQSGIHKFYVQERENDRELGDVLEIAGDLQEISFATYESQFDFNSYLKDKGVFYELKSHNITVVFANPLRINKRKDEFLKPFDETSRNAIDALLFSRRNYDAEIIKSASSMNIVFLFSMCGVYLRLLMVALEYFLRLKLSDKVARIATFVFAMPFYLLSFEKLAIHRLIFCYGGRLVNDFFLNKKISYLSLISIVGIIFIAIDFHNAYQMAYLLGFGLSILIIFLRTALRVFHRKTRSLMMGIFIFAFLIPIHLGLSYELHLFQIVIQYVTMPLNTVFFFVSAFSFFTWPMVNVLSFMANILTSTYALLSKIDIVLIVGEPNLIFYFLYYGLYFYLPYLLESSRKRDAKNVAVILASGLVFSAIPVQNYVQQAIHFINVGQGDAILIQSHGHNALIDTGGSLLFDMAEETLIPFFKKKEIYKLDYLITTHDDFDHSGAATSLIANFRVEQTIDKATSFPLSLGDLVIENLNSIYGSDANDNSLVLTLLLLNKRWLLMGDASKAVEERLIEKFPNLDTDYLKIGHHGSNSSTGEKFIRKVSPSEAIISVGRHNYYGHPHQEVIALLNRYGVRIRRTDLEGTISYSSALF